MTASLLTKNNRPYYYVVVRYRDDSTGKERQKWIKTDILIKGNNKRKAEEKLRQIVAQFKKEDVDLGKDILFTVFIKDWFESLKSSVESSTYDAYKINVYNRILPFFDPKKLKVSEITPSHIQKFINHHLELVSSNTVRKYLVNLSRCLDSAVKQNIIAYNPVSRVDLPKKNKFMGAKYYNEKQIEKLLEQSKGDSLEIVILLAVFYGLRRSEVLGLKWDAIDFNNNTITIKHTVTRISKTLHKMDSTKNSSSYAMLPLPDMIKRRLKIWKKQQVQNKLLQPNDYVDEGYVCTKANGEIFRPDYISQHFKILLKRFNLPHIRFHDLRHSSASYLKHLGFDMKDIQTWLRHGDIQTTMNIYTHLDMSEKRNIADNLNEKFVSFGS